MWCTFYCRGWASAFTVKCVKEKFTKNPKLSRGPEIPNLVCTLLILKSKTFPSVQFQPPVYRAHRTSHVKVVAAFVFVWSVFIHTLLITNCCIHLICHLSGGLILINAPTHSTQMPQPIACSREVKVRLFLISPLPDLSWCDWPLAQKNPSGCWSLRFWAIR